jgi:IS30 family transposase
VGEGHLVARCGASDGCRDQQLRRYVWWTGGVRPAARRRAPCGLSVGEREEISRGLARGDTCRQIAVDIGRCHTTISREVDRNGGRERYRAGEAEAATWQRARRPKVSKLAANAPLRAVVEEKLGLLWSPQQIAGWLGRTYPDDEAMRISHETIYLSLFVQTRGALRRELTAHLRSGHVTRRPQGRALPSGRGQITDNPWILA